MHHILFGLFPPNELPFSPVFAYKLCCDESLYTDQTDSLGWIPKVDRIAVLKIMQCSIFS